MSTSRGWLVTWQGGGREGRHRRTVPTAAPRGMPRAEPTSDHALPRSPTIWPYELPAELVRAHASPSGQNVLEDVLREAIRRSPHRAASAEQADLFYVPVPLHWGGKGRAAAAAVLSYVRAAWPYFNRSLHSSHPNHLLLFTGDLGMDAPPSRRFADALPPEIDVAAASRHFVALTLTGNPESGFQRGKDVVLPPSHNLKGGPMARDRCCEPAESAASPHSGADSQSTAKRRGLRLPRRLVSPLCKLVPRDLPESNWHRRPAMNGSRANGLFLLSWAGQASGGGMGRHGGSGPNARRWLATSVARELAASSLITDTNSASHRERNVRELPPSMLVSTRVGHKMFGVISPAASPRSVFCAAPYGRGNGWEGRSALAVREGCVPLRIHPLGAQMALEPFVDWSRFSVQWDDTRLSVGSARRLGTALASYSDAQLDIMRCEMACAATHTSWEAPSCPPASCALAARGQSLTRHGALATLLTILGNRRLPPERRRAPRPCPCDRGSDKWHF